MSSALENSSAGLVSFSSSDQKQALLITDAKGSVKRVDEAIAEVSQPDTVTQLKQRIRQVLIASLDTPQLKLKDSQTIQMSNLGERPTPKQSLPVPERTLSPDYEAIIAENIAVLEHFPPGDRLLQKTIPFVDNLVISLLETKKKALAKLIKNNKSLTSFEASGRLILSSLSKPFEFNNRVVKSREITEINLIEGEKFAGAILDEDPVYEPGEIDVHTHIIRQEESSQLDNHVTLADVKAILESAPWFDPDTKRLQPRFRVHAILTIMADKKGLLTGASGRGIFSFYILDLDAESAKKGQPPFGLSRVPRTIVIDF